MSSLLFFQLANKLQIELEGKSIGIIGVGNCGSRVAQKCAALGMKVFLNDPPLQRQTNDPKYSADRKAFRLRFYNFSYAVDI